MFGLSVVVSDGYGGTVRGRGLVGDEAISGRL